MPSQKGWVTNSVWDHSVGLSTACQSAPCENTLISKTALLRTICLGVTNCIKSRKLHPLRYACKQHFHCLVQLKWCITSSSCCPQRSMATLSGAQISQNIKWHLWSLRIKSCCKAWLSYCTGTPISSLRLLKEQRKQAFDLNSSSKDYTLTPPLRLSTVRCAPHQERQTFPLLHELHPDLFWCQNPAHVIVYPHTHCHPIVLAIS